MVTKYQIEGYIDKDAPLGKKHIGYIVDRTGYREFKKWALMIIFNFIAK